MRINTTNYKAYLVKSESSIIAVAKTTDNIRTIERIARNSKNRKVLKALALNSNISKDVVNILFSRNFSDVNAVLADLGYKRSKFLGLF